MAEFKKKNVRNKANVPTAKSEVNNSLRGKNPICENIKKKTQEELNKELLKAAETGDEKAVKRLLGRGADVNAKGFFERTPLHYAVEKGRWFLFDLFVDNGADINARDRLGLTPLHFAVSCHYVQPVWYLIRKGADINARDSRGWTPLHHAADCSSTEATLVLVKHGADINAKDEGGNTPLHLATFKWNDSHICIFIILSENGADPLSMNKFGITPISVLALRKTIQS